MTLARLPRGRFAVTDAVLEVLDLRARQGRFQLTGVDVDLVRTGDDVTLTGHVDLPEHLGSSIDVEAEAGGELADSDAVNWRVRVEANDLDLAEWAAMLPDSFRVPAEGRGSIRVSARGVGPRRDEPAAPARARGPALPGAPRRSRAWPATSACSVTTARSRSRPPISSCRGPARPGARRASRRGSRARTGASSRPPLRADSVRIENIAALAEALPAGSLRERIAALAPRGELRGLDLTVTDVGERRLPDVTGRLSFSDIGFGPLGRAAGITGFDGTLEGRGGGGIVTLATRDATIDWPQQLRAPIPVLRGDGRLEWQRFDTGIRLWLDDAFGDSGHGSARGKLRMVLRPGELPLFDLSATATDVDVSQLWRYLPTAKLSPKAIRWLDDAFRAGRVTTADVSITGPTKGFPYREGQGLFRASGHASGVEPPLRARLAGAARRRIGLLVRRPGLARGGEPRAHRRRRRSPTRRSTARTCATRSSPRAAGRPPTRPAPCACCRRRRSRRPSAPLSPNSRRRAPCRPTSPCSCRSRTSTGAW